MRLYYLWICLKYLWWYVRHNFIHSSMALQPFVGPWLLLQFRNLFYTVGGTPWTSDQFVARPLRTQRATQTQNKRTHTDIHALSGIRTHDPSVRASEGSLCLRPRGHCDRNVIISVGKITENRSHVFDKVSGLVILVHILCWKQSLVDF
jgi:hypothetical protein